MLEPDTTELSGLEVGVLPDGPVHEAPNPEFMLVTVILLKPAPAPAPRLLGTWPDTALVWKSLPDAVPGLLLPEGRAVLADPPDTEAGLLFTELVGRLPFPWFCLILGAGTEEAEWDLTSDRGSTVGILPEFGRHENKSYSSLPLIV